MISEEEATRFVMSLTEVEKAELMEILLACQNEPDLMGVLHQIVDGTEGRMI